MLTETPIRSIDSESVLIMGCDRMLLLYLSFASAPTAAMSMFPNCKFLILVGAIMWFGGVWILRKMGKADPFMFDIYRKNRRFRRFYRAETTPFRVDQADWKILIGGIFK